MANLAQHEAAELWELARDHFISSAKLNWFSQHVQDAQLRSTLEQHARRFQQAAQQIDGFLHQHAGNYGTQDFYQSQQWHQPYGQAANQFQAGSPAYGQGAQGGTWQGTGYQAQQSFDVFVVGECLKECKALAVQCVRGATECSQPARQYLYQLAGEHLQMAEQHYRWLEQRGIYASPRADQSALREYNQKLHQLWQAGQQAVQAMQQHRFSVQPQQAQPYYFSQAPQHQSLASANHPGSQLQ